ncbi:AI-2E family transporter [Fibrobacterales bacterium]|nr:AI-2E family transporter [Fibrobacterales bacterium]
MSNNYWNIDRIMMLIFGLLGSAIFITLLAYLSDVLFPFVVAFLLAYILNPFVNKLQKFLKYRVLSALAVLLIFAGIIIGAAFVLVPVIADQVVHLSDLLRKLATDNAWQAKLSQYLPENMLEMISEKVNFEFLLQQLQNFDALKAIQELFAKLLPGAFGALSWSMKVFAWLAGLFMVILYMMFLLLDFEHIRGVLARQIPSAYNEKVLDFFRNFDYIMSQYFRAQTLVAGLVGVLFATAFSIMNLPMGLPFGLFIGCLNMIPYMQILSIPLAVFLGLIYSLDVGTSFWQVLLIITAIYAGIQVLQDLVITPKVMGKALGLSPVLILLSLSVWGKLLGFLGLVVAIPFTCAVLVLYKDVREGIRIHRKSIGEE